MISIDKDKILELLFEPTLQIIDRLEQVRDKLGPEEVVLLDRLKFQVGIYAYKRSKKEKEDADGFFQKPNQNFSN